MGDLIPREDRISLQARRAGDVEPEPIVIQLPAGQAAPVIPPQPGVTQNIVYVVVPNPQHAPPAPPVIPAASSEVHYHTTNNFHPPKRRRERGTSFFGGLSLVCAVVACVTAYVPPIASTTPPIAITGAALGALGFVVSTLFRRSGGGVPLMGILICAAAYGMWLNNTGHLQGKYDQLKNQSPVPLPAIDFNSGKSTLPASGARPSVLPPPNPPPTSLVPNSGHIPGDHSIFGDSSSLTNPPVDQVQPPPTAAPITPVPAAISEIDLATANADLEAAKMAAAKRLGLDYSTTKSAAMAANTAYEQAKIIYSPGSPELIAAHQKELAAASQLAQMEADLKADESVAAQEQVLKNARR